MKKILFFIGLSLLCAVSSPAQNTDNAAPLSALVSAMASKNGGKPNLVRRAILVSDLDAFKQAFVEPQTQYSLDMDLIWAVDICNPYRNNSFSKATCDLQNNAEIIRLLVERGADPNARITLVTEEANSIYKASTLADKLKTNNYLALKYILPKMEKCLLALTQMQEIDPSIPNYHVYADTWRNNKCLLKKYEVELKTRDKEKLKRFYLIGKDKKAVQKKFGKKPSVYEHPSEYREILTYKKVETDVTTAGYSKIYRTKEIHDVFVIDRGVVTQVKQFVVSVTKGGEETQVRDYEQLIQEEIKKKEKQANQRVFIYGIELEDSAEPKAK